MRSTFKLLIDRVLCAVSGLRGLIKHAVTGLDGGLRAPAPPPRIVWLLCANNHTDITKSDSASFRSGVNMTEPSVCNAGWVTASLGLPATGSRGWSEIRTYPSTVARRLLQTTGNFGTMSTLHPVLLAAVSAVTMASAAAHAGCLHYGYYHNTESYTRNRS